MTMKTIADELREAAASSDSPKGLSALMVNAADEIERVTSAWQERLSARNKAFAGFGHNPAVKQDGNEPCACAYCTRDAESLAEMTAEYELQKEAAIQKARALEADGREHVAALRAIIDNGACGAQWCVNTAKRALGEYTERVATEELESVGAVDPQAANKD